MSALPTPALSTADTYQRLVRHDPALMAGLRRGDPEVVQAVGRVLRLTPLRRLSADPASLVAALSAVPQLAASLQRAWGREDPILTSNLFAWAEQSRRHHPPAPIPRRTTD